MKIFLLGFMGSGKSYWGRMLSESLELPLLDMDEEIEKMMGLSIPEIFAHKGEDYFRQLEHDELHSILQQDAFVLSCGGGLPCYYDNMAVMNRHGLTIWLNVPLAVMTERLKKKKYKRPLLKDIDDEQLSEYIEKKLQERRVFYEQAQLIIDPTEFTIESLTAKIRSCISPI
jgi:shikimate kinase